MKDFYTSLNESTLVLLSLSIILFAGFLLTRLTKRLHLPNVSGYILAGVLIGPQVASLVPAHILSHMGFISDVALAFIAFGVGKFFKKEGLMKTGWKVVIVTLWESVLAGILITLSMRFLFHLSWDFCLILGAIATATAPASTMMTIRQYRAKGDFVNILLQVVALDDVVCLLIFSVVVAVINAGRSGHVRAGDVLLPIFYNIAALGIGFLCGYLLSRLITPTRSKDNRLILAIAMLMGISGLCSAFDLSPLLSCMVFGASYINLTEDKKLFRQVDRFTPPVLSMFFIVSGMNLDLTALKTAGVIGIAYFLIRILGKYGGMYLGCAITGMPDTHKKYMGLALIPQAGVAIGLAFLGQRLLPENIGNLLLTIILSSSVLYELVGPACAKMSFFLSGTIKREKAAVIEKSDGAGTAKKEKAAVNAKNEGKGKVKKYPDKKSVKHAI